MCTWCSGKTFDRDSRSTHLAVFASGMLLWDWWLRPGWLWFLQAGDGIWASLHVAPFHQDVTWQKQLAVNACLCQVGNIWDSFKMHFIDVPVFILDYCTVWNKIIHARKRAKKGPCRFKCGCSLIAYASQWFGHQDTLRVLSQLIL